MAGQINLEIQAQISFLSDKNIGGVFVYGLAGILSVCFVGCEDVGVAQLCENCLRRHMFVCLSAVRVSKQKPSRSTHGFKRLYRKWKDSDTLASLCCAGQSVSQ